MIRISKQLEPVNERCYYGMKRCILIIFMAREAFPLSYFPIDLRVCSYMSYSSHPSLFLSSSLFVSLPNILNNCVSRGRFVVDVISCLVILHISSLFHFPNHHLWNEFLPFFLFSFFLFSLPPLLSFFSFFHRKLSVELLNASSHRCRNVDSSVIILPL